MEKRGGHKNVQPKVCQDSLNLIRLVTYTFLACPYQRVLLVCTTKSIIIINMCAFIAAKLPSFGDEDLMKSKLESLPAELLILILEEVDDLASVDVVTRYKNRVQAFR